MTRPLSQDKGLRKVPYLLFGAALPFVSLWCFWLLDHGPATWPLAVWSPLWACATLARVSLPIELPRRARPMAGQVNADSFPDFLAELDEERRNLAPGITTEVIADFAEMTLRPAVYRRRVTERIDLRRDWSPRSVTIDMHLPPRTSPDIALIPLTQPRKGRRLYSFELHSDSQAAVLNNRDCLVIVCAAFELLLRRLMPEEMSPDDSRLVTDAFETARLAGLRRILFDLRTEKADDKFSTEGEMLKAALDMLDRIVAPLWDPSDAWWAGRADLDAFLDLQARHTTLIVRRAPEQYFSLTYSYVSYTPGLLRQRSTHPDSMLAWFRGRYKKFAGSVELKVERARRCASYHLELTVPRGSYVGRAVLTDDEAQRITSSAPTDYNTNTWRYWQSSETADHVYFYGKNLQRIGAEHLRINVPVRERVWGSTFVFLISSLFVLLFDVLLASTKDEHAVPSSVDIAALSLSLPAALIGMFSSFVVLYGRVLHISLTAVCGTLLSALLFLVTISAFAVKTYVSSADEPNSLHGFFRVSVGLGVILVGTALTTFIVRLVRYHQTRRHLSRKSPQ